MTNNDWQPWQICQPYICPLGSKTVSVSPSLFFTLIFLLLPPHPSHSSLSALSVYLLHTTTSEGSLSIHFKLICTAFWKSLHLAMTKLNHFTCRAFQHLHKNHKNPKEYHKPWEITWIMIHTVSCTVAGVMQMHHFHYIWQITQLYK